MSSPRAVPWCTSFPVCAAVVWGSKTPMREVTPTAPPSLPIIPGAVSQAMGAGDSRSAGQAAVGSWGGGPKAGLCRSSRDSAAPSIRSGSIFWERYHACFPPAASPDRLVCQPFPAGAPCRAVPRQAALIRHQPPRPDPGVGLGRAGTARCSGQGAGAGREPGHAGNWGVHEWGDL